ncbi:MAG: helix-hairpin-helix domain-containing protein [Clostridia bacterium]|nr:helix-hairpin-helix domain-containing protein [Clostridia bacterium]
MMKKDEFYERFLFLPIIVIVVSVLCIVFNGYAQLFSEEEIPYAEPFPVESAEKVTYTSKKVEKLESGDEKIDINTATVEDFQRLPGIGVVRANDAVKQREKMGGFRTLEDLMCTEGIGPKVFELLADFIRISN